MSDRYMMTHGRAVGDGEIWLVRVYTPAKPAHAKYPTHYPATPARIEWEIAQARVDEGIDDETDELCTQIGWARFGSEIYVGNEYLGRGLFVQPVHRIAESADALSGEVYVPPIPAEW